MIEINGILCPVDFSPCSRRTLDYAAGIARWYGAKLTVLHVVPMAVPARDLAWTMSRPAHAESIGIEAFRPLLTGFVAAEAPQGVVIDTQVVEGPVADEIVTQANLRAADLIVIGTHGRSGVRRFMLGSVAEKVMRTASCAVMTVPAASPEMVPIAPGLFESILCPLDFSAASLQALRWALAIAEEADAELSVVHVLEQGSATEHRSFPRPALTDYRTAYEQWAIDALHDSVPPSARRWCTVHELTRMGSAPREIVQTAEERYCDLIVMGVGSRREFGDRVFGSTTQQVVRSAGCPVLTIREET